MQTFDIMLQLLRRPKNKKKYRVMLKLISVLAMADTEIILNPVKRDKRTFEKTLQPTLIFFQFTDQCI